jgi:hypothetical protein
MVPFQAIKDGRTYDRAPLLKPTGSQRKMAERAFLRARDRLPINVRDRLEKRKENEGHYINTVRYYPFPILAYGGSSDSIEELIRWGHTYATILIKIASAYRNPGNGAIRRFLYLSLTRYLSPHLLELIVNYRTVDDLAGAHLGDDNLKGWSVEWNLGSVGGLDEGFCTAKEIAKTAKLPEEPGGLNPVERDPVESIRDAIHWAYKSFCLGNQIPAVPRPYIACIEHDDLYGSTVSICERLKEIGEDVHLCFHQELSFRDGKLVTSSNRGVDLAYMDCHLEDLPHRHPLIKAASENAVEP